MSIACRECEGCGREDCPSCDGSGSINGVKCLSCYGEGDIACEYCGGRGVVETIKRSTLNLALIRCGF